MEKMEIAEGNKLREIYDQLDAYEKEISEHNTVFIKQFGKNSKRDFNEMCSDCKVTDKIEFVEKPNGTNQDESYGIYKDIHVDQRSVGDSGDSYAGAIYAKVKNKWIRVYYEC